MNKKTETDIQRYWELSQTWKGTGQAVGVKTHGELLDALMPLAEQEKSQHLATQADDLAMLVIHAKQRRKKVKGKVIPISRSKKATLQQKAA
jgi:hypothetical protein